MDRKVPRKKDASPEAGRAEAQTDLALERTVLAAERTLLAWIRTGISLITFGFTIYKFLTYQILELKLKSIVRPEGPRRFGLLMLASGMVVLGIAVWQHYRYMTRIGAPAGRAFGSPLFVALLMFLIASFLFASIAVAPGLF